MRSFAYFASMARATFASRSLRPSVFSRALRRSGKRFRASCIVIVENPCAMPPARRFAKPAPKMRRKSIPPCE
jgi:hypothetical protein